MTNKIARKQNDGQNMSRIIATESLAFEASAAGLSERYGRGKTSHTLQVWWARRPHAAMRSVCFASIADAPNTGLDNGISAAIEPIDGNAPEALEQFHDRAVLDFFGGGGTIPFEAARLGAKSIAIDYNPLSVFIQTVNLVFSQKAFSKHGKDKTIQKITEVGELVLQNLKASTSDLYPGRSRSSDAPVFGYFWTYSKKCSNCGTSYTLQKRPWLSKKKGKERYVGVTESSDRAWEISSEGEPPKSNWVGRSGSTECPSCGATHGRVDVRECTDTLIAIGKTKRKRGKEFEISSNSEAYPEEIVNRTYDELLAELGSLPDTDVPRWSGIINPSLYGIEKHVEVLNKRQSVLLLLLIKELREQYYIIREEESDELANFTVGALIGLIDQIVDWNCRLSMWIPQNEQVGRGFCGPGIAMLWDYVETDQLLSGPANLWDKLKRIVNGVSEIPEFNQLPTVKRATAQSTGLEDQSIDAVVTDPPYYDNMFYNTLADFFYVWKRYGFKDIFVKHFELEQSEFDRELVASTKRQGRSAQAHSWYVSELTNAMNEARRVLKDDGVISFVYGHSSLSGWAAVVEAFKNAKLSVVNVQPLSIERRARPRAMTSEAVNTCLVLVAMKRESALTNLADPMTIGKELTKVGWTNEDAGMAAFASSLSNIINAEEVVHEHSIREAIKIESRKISEKFNGFKITDRKSI